MKTYKTKTMEVEKLIWEPQYNYSEYVDKEVEYTYDSTAYLRILIGILCLLFTAVSVFICFYLGITGFGSGTPLNDWQAILWVIPWFTAVCVAIIVSIRLCDIAKSDEDANEQRVRGEIYSQYKLKLKEISEQRDAWRKEHKLECLANDFVSNNITITRLCELCKDLSTKEQIEIFTLIDNYRDYRESLKK